MNSSSAGSSPWKRLLLGRRLANREQAEQAIGAVAGLPALGLDGLASSAYGPEAALTLLLPLGLAGPRYLLPITGVLLALLALSPPSSSREPGSPSSRSLP